MRLEAEQEIINLRALIKERDLEAFERTRARIHRIYNFYKVSKNFKNIQEVLLNE